MNCNIVLNDKEIHFTLEADPHYCRCGVFGVYRIREPYDFVVMDNDPPPGTSAQCPPADKAIKDLRQVKFPLVR
jgi:hypothetical protein